MRRTRPPILNDSRISCLVTTTPLVSIGGTAGPWLAFATRTGVGRAASGASDLPQPAMNRLAMSVSGASVAYLLAFMWRSQRQRARGSGVVELGLAGEHFESRDIEIELGAREARARVDEFHLADHALVALAARDAEGGARGFGARVGRGQGVGAGVQPVERLLDLELHLLHELVELGLRAAGRGVGLANRRAARAAVEEGPVEQQRDGVVVGAATELVVLALDAG